MFRPKAFTLIELLVVIAVIALLLAIILPALKIAKQQGSAAVCMSNEHQLALVWALYYDDNDGFIVDSDTGDTVTGYYDYGSITIHTFVADPQDINGNLSNSSVEDKVRGYRRGALWPYMDGHKVFRCPHDNRYRKPPATTQLSWVPNNFIGGYRSYSMGAPLSQWSLGATGSGENLTVVTKFSEFVNPSFKIVWLEEADGAGWNHRTWNMELDEYRWVDPFAIWHNGSSTFAFADGHSARQKWVEDVTIRMAEEQIKWMSTTSDDRDYRWFKKHYVPGRMPGELILP
jgi:prepilin-type N-terminal cleavage/methylation domain-containing protein/prepilin-type processing-associated H-X9-DG protein